MEEKRSETGRVKKKKRQQQQMCSQDLNRKFLLALGLCTHSHLFPHMQTPFLSLHNYHIGKKQPPAIWLPHCLLKVLSHNLFKGIDADVMAILLSILHVSSNALPHMLLCQHPTFLQLHQKPDHGIDPPEDISLEIL